MNSTFADLYRHWIAIVALQMLCASAPGDCDAEQLGHHGGVAAHASRPQEHLDGSAIALAQSLCLDYISTQRSWILSPVLEYGRAHWWHLNCKQASIRASAICAVYNLKSRRGLQTIENKVQSSHGNASRVLLSHSTFRAHLSDSGPLLASPNLLLPISVHLQVAAALKGGK